MMTGCGCAVLTDHPPFVRAALLADVPHGFFGRRGGVSAGELASLNTGLGSGDDPALIARNRARVRDAILPGAALLGVYQVHGVTCAVAEGAWDDADRPEADALVTNQPHVLLSILTADCVPVLFSDTDAGVVGAAHAGWKGALGGVTNSTLAAMERLGAERSRIHAAIGPCIGRASYEVDTAFVIRFCNADPANERFFIDGRPGHALFDIAAYVAHRLAAVGIGRVDMIGHDTCALADEYYSYRRATLLKENSYGRQLSVIGIGR
jgi:polyphenol oxidase